MEKFTSSRPLNSAVLFLIFNRPHTTKQVFEAIREAKPQRLYIASDGARKHKRGEAEVVQSVREYVIENIDWNCEFKTFFRDTNLGCKYAVSGAISWFFENEEQGIILEDDCLPNQSFFWFCDDLLKMYKDDLRVGQISGDNFQDGIKRGKADYYFSIHNHIWGWATWKNRWDKYNVTLDNIENPMFLNDVFNNSIERKSWERVFFKMKEEKIDTWDYQWSFCLWNENMLTAIPNINLVKNIGFGADATHTKVENKFCNNDTQEILVKTHPSNILQNFEADMYFFEKSRKPNIFLRILNKFLRILNKIVTAVK